MSEQAHKSEQTQDPFIPAAKWNDYHDWPPPGGMRHLIFHADSNGFKDAFARVGGRVLVDHQRFWKIVSQRRGK